MFNLTKDFKKLLVPLLIEALIELLKSKNKTTKKIKIKDKKTGEEKTETEEIALVDLTEADYKASAEFMANKMLG